MAARTDELVTIRELGQGAHTRVTLVRNVTTQELLCRKTTRAEAPNFESQIRQMRNEFEVGQHNEHRALRRSLDFQLIRRMFRPVEAHLLLQFIDGIPFGQWAESASPAGVLKVLWHIADGLADLHGRGFVHADLKPQNVLCAANGRPTLIDFGQSCPARHVKQRIQGTADFIAPEQVNCEPLDARTDVFGFGAMMHLIFLGKPAQTELNATSVRRGGRITLERRTASRQGEEIALDPPLMKLIEDCLQPERTERPTNMSEVKDRLEICFNRLSPQTAPGNGRR
jgi:serine/threonine protein kinase